jgi:superfamily II DNA or RNA helicase
MTIEAKIEKLLTERNAIDDEINRLQAVLATQSNIAFSTEIGIKEECLQTENTSMKLSESSSFSDYEEVPSVTKASSLQEKYDLFMSLFAGRLDVHAKRFQSVKTGKSGYSPVCRNEFNRMYCSKGMKGIKRVPCMKCEYHDFPSISIDEFTAHIRGAKDNCNDVLGSYPMDSDEKCSFIVADFDNEGRKKEDAALIGDNGDRKAMQDAAIAFRKTCEANGIAAYNEKSRSGNGMHTWIFFSERVPAKDARKLCTMLLTEAMNVYPGIRFNSYDRLLPTQDVLPDGGLGNLIALPLQGQAGRNHNSVFVDDASKMYTDQWAHLSSIKKVAVSDIDRVIESRTTSELGELLSNDDGEGSEKPWEKRTTIKGLNTDDFSGMVSITRANMLHVEKQFLSAKAGNAIKRLGSFRNPDFYKAQAMRLPTWDKPRIISTSEETDEYISIPRGAEDALLELFGKSGVTYEICDKTEKGTKLDASFVGVLREEQIPAAEAMAAHDIGVLSATTAFGKTVIGSYLIADKGVNALVLVHNAQLQSQWVESLRTFLDIENNPPERFTGAGRKKKVDVIGVYGGSKKNPSGLVDVVMMQSLHKGGDVQDFIKDYGLVIVDECHHVPAVSFEAVLKHTNAKYVYGLTATPVRNDGHHAITFLECGPIRYKVDAKAQAEKRPFEHYIIPRFTNLLPTSIHENSGISVLLNDVAADSRRNKMIAGDVIRAIEAGRKPIILTERTEHVTELSDMLATKCDNVISMVGGMGTKKKREINQQLLDLDSDEKFVIVATGKYVGEGFDFPRLDTLFLALPIAWKGKVAQYTGRLHRIYKGKDDVIVYDYVDAHIPVLERMYYKRIKGYKSVGYKTIAKEQDNDNTNFIYSIDEFYSVFCSDCERAKTEIVISSPNLTMRRVSAMLSVLSSKLVDNVIITVFTRSIEENRENTRSKVSECISRLKSSGIRVTECENLHQRFVVIDQSISWYGSVNPLGYANADDNIMRLSEEDVAIALLENVQQWSHVETGVGGGC